MPKAHEAAPVTFADGPHTAPLSSFVSARITASAYYALQARALAEQVSEGTILRRWMRMGFFAETGKNLEMVLFE